MLAAYSQTLVETRLGSLDPILFLWTAAGYTLANAISAIAVQVLPRHWFGQNRVSFGLVSFDIVSLALLMYFSGGIASGLAALILITVATGAILVTGRVATLIAAVASIALLYEEFYLAISFSEPNYDFFQAGVFGAIYFALSLAIQRLSNRIRENDIQALTQAAELADLERLNKQIIQRMRTGIIVVDKDSQVRMHNQSARSLIGAAADEPLRQMPVSLDETLTRWRTDTNYRAAPFKVAHHTPEIKVNFASVRNAEPEGDVTIFIEDTSEVQQQAQQLKLAELGRLSASIAHEIRNPLGAISHAAQLLNESQDLQPADQRLTDIIINHCNRMNGVVENVLEMSRRRTPEPQRTILSESLQDFVNQARESFPEASIECDVDPEDTLVRIDPDHLTQVLTNLIDNALRYSDENGKGNAARMEGGVEPNSERPFLNVIDFGTGVADEQLPNLFQPFSTTASGGTGLGLYIAKELCEANQAHLSYFRHEEGGSCFRILFTHPDRIFA